VSADRPAHPDCADSVLSLNEHGGTEGGLTCALKGGAGTGGVNTGPAFGVAAKGVDVLLLIMSLFGPVRKAPHALVDSENYLQPR
jgi:hypothetical protein